MDKKKHYYIYKITILTGRLKGHYYIGQHETNNLNDGYRGSGTRIKRWYKSKERIEGVDYIKEILCFCDSWDEMQIKEDEYIGDKYDTDILCLNEQRGGHNKLSKEAYKRAGKSNSKYWREHPDEKKKQAKKSGETMKKDPNHTKRCRDNAIKGGKKNSESQKKYWSEHPEEVAAKTEKTRIGLLKFNEENPDFAKERAKKCSETYNNKPQEEKDRMNKHKSDVQHGSIFMTDGICKPLFVIQKKQQELFDKGWYRCHRDKTPWEEKVA